MKNCINPSATTPHLSNILNFIKEYSVRCVDEHTLIIEPMTNHSKHDSNNEQPAYLIKYAEITHNRIDISDISDTLAKHSLLNKKYLLTLLGHNVVETVHGSVIEAVYQYGRKNLREEIGNRIVHGATFHEDELWAILSTITKALLHLEENGIFYGVLSAEKIFIHQTVKLLDPSATAMDPMMIAEGRLYSPEILHHENEIDILKSDVYVTGLIILECGLLLDLSSEENPDLSHYFDMFSQIYSQQLYALIQQMLAILPDNRPSFEQIKQLFTHEDDSFNQTKTSLLPLQNDIEAPMSKPVLIEQTEEYQTVDINGEDEKVLSEYERAKRDYLYMGNQNRSTSSSASSSRISRLPLSILTHHNQQNRLSFSNSRKTKEIKNRLMKSHMKQTKVDLVQRSYEEESDRDLFTAPQLMRIIQNDLKCLKQSCKSNLPSMKYKNWKV